MADREEPGPFVHHRVKQAAVQSAVEAPSPLISELKVAHDYANNEYCALM